MDEDISFEEAQAQIDFWSRQVYELQEELNEYDEDSEEWYSVQNELNDAENELYFYENLYIT